MENKDYIRVFTGSYIQATLIKSRFEEANISPVIKNDTESGRLAGFGPTVVDQVQVFVHQDEHATALEILDTIKDEIN
ncbi:putative signal transducing protein [Joostella sp. CR20]|uniref:putative signal transducing protein n=1 Tax=Joostella sp. CR20 TaxID=2804312 RepID=UPI00313E82BF